MQSAEITTEKRVTGDKWENSRLENSAQVLSAWIQEEISWGEKRAADGIFVERLDPQKYFPQMSASRMSQRKTKTWEWPWAERFSFPRCTFPYSLLLFLSLLLSFDGVRRSQGGGSGSNGSLSPGSFFRIRSLLVGNVPLIMAGDGAGWALRPFPIYFGIFRIPFSPSSPDPFLLPVIPKSSIQSWNLWGSATFPSSFLEIKVFKSKFESRL